MGSPLCFRLVYCSWLRGLNRVQSPLNMPSPIVHSAVGYLIYRGTSSEKLPPLRPCTRAGWIWLLGSLFFSLAPDLDAIPGVLAGDFRAFHNQWTHSLLVGLAVALVTGLIARWRKAPAGRWFLMTLIGYSLHIGLDFFTRGGRGIMLFGRSPASVLWGHLNCSTVCAGRQDYGITLTW
jgi:membrane-bound metal-dependent hydrolase YbcI (DUF457 family)